MGFQVVDDIRDPLFLHGLFDHFRNIDREPVKIERFIDRGESRIAGVIAKNLEVIESELASSAHVFFHLWFSVCPSLARLALGGVPSFYNVETSR
ncbi:MAG: hypothetical protein JOY86_01240 [Candidatus Eremiobacteraeota bacterium]|nr:hypothetical protein [Candidatus Eremiobacteraeota bacterium]